MTSIMGDVDFETIILEDDEQKQLKPSLLDFLEMEDTGADNAVYRAHHGAWSSLGTEVDKRTRAVQQALSGSAAEKVLERRDSIREEMRRLESGM